ncbi:MAG: KpsF/GutQ family sugar-phosphate isomerase [Paracoccaceae bacterium]
MKSPYLTTARRVIGLEADALRILADAIDDAFAHAVEALLRARGRVVVSGMGKSGHVARKIAATFASTGTPAQFVHPAEASHGDLGMMARGDVALVLSNSGETPELADLVAHTRRFDIPLIGVAARRDSALIRAADVALILPPAAEACGTGVVPTTSTTMTLALGDALAVALMEHRRFSPADFRDFHPGGKLGARLSKVADLMHPGDEMPLVAPDTPMADALIEMTRKGFGILGVLDGGRLAGTITDGDLRRHMSGLLDARAGDVMTPNPATIAPSELAETALRRMNERRITQLFAAQDGAPVGVLHVHDCLRAGIG